MKGKQKLNQVKDRFLFFSPTVQGQLENEPCSQDFQPLAGLGQGAFGKVFKCKHKVQNKIYALKQISKKQIKAQQAIQQVRNEIKIMYKLNHNNIIKLYNHFEEEEYIYLILEYASGGQLWQQLNQIGRFDENTVKNFIKDTLSALDYLHSEGVIHRDIKPENLLLDENNKIKMADFGWSNFFNEQSKRFTYGGTPDYLAPEMINESGHDTALDLWCIGVLIYELLTGKSPFAPSEDISDSKERQRKLEDNVLNLNIKYPSDFPQLAKDLVQNLLKKNPQQRATIQQCKTHPWLYELFKDEIEKQKTAIQQQLSFIQIQDLNLINDPTGFTKEQIVDIANRPGSIMNPIIQIQSNQDQNQRTEQYYQKLVEDLTQKNQQLIEKIQKFDVLYKTKLGEIEQVKRELASYKSGELSTDTSFSSNSQDLKKINYQNEKIKQLENENLKYQEQLQLKENLLYKQNFEIQKVEELKKDVEKYKNEKNLINNQLKKLQIELQQKENKINELLDDSKYSMQSQSQLSNVYNDKEYQFQQSLITKELQNLIQEVNLKASQLKDNLEQMHNLQNKYKEIEKENYKMKLNFDNQIKQIQQELQDDFQNQVEQITEKFQQQIHDLEFDRDQKVRQMQSKIDSLKKDEEQYLKQENEFKSLLKQFEIEQLITKNIMQEYEQLKKLKRDLTEENKKMTMQIKQKNDMLRSFTKC